MSTSASITSTPTSDSPPIVELAYLLRDSIFLAYSALSYLIHRSVVPLSRTFLHILSFISSLVRYLLSPPLLLLHVACEILVIAPWNILYTLVENLAPLYAFVGAAVLFALCIGAAAKAAIHLVSRVLLQPADPRVAAVEKETLPSKLRKRGSIHRNTQR